MVDVDDKDAFSGDENVVYLGNCCWTLYKKHALGLTLIEVPKAPRTQQPRCLSATAERVAPRTQIHIYKLTSGKD